MGNEQDIRRELRQWVDSKARHDTPPVDDTTPLLASGALTSLHIPELILLIESLHERLVDIEHLGQGDFLDIETIVERFFATEVPA